MTKENFCKIIDNIKRIHAFQEALYFICRDYTWEANIEFPTLESDVISLLEEVMDCPPDDVAGSDISYFVYDLDFGKNWKPGMITSKDGKDIDHSTAEKLYDYLTVEK